jgi:flavorubredoxin
MKIDEIAPDVYRISIYVPEIQLQFNHFLIRDDEPMLFHTGLRRMFPLVREAVDKLVSAQKLRWIGWSHFESDECGALNEWLAIAPQAQAVCGFVGAMVNVNDFAAREARILAKDEVLSTGKHRFRFISTPHVPHGWDAGVMFEEVNRTLLCSDLLHQNGDVEALTESDVLGRVRETLTLYNQGPFANYLPFTKRTRSILNSLADLEPKTLAAMHGSAYRGDCSRALRDLADVMEETL